MNVIVNGQTRTLADGLTVAEFMQSEMPSTRGAAVAVDSQVVPRAEWPQFELRAGNAVEVLTAVQGG